VRPWDWTSTIVNPGPPGASSHPKRRRRSFTPQFKAQVVLEVLPGQCSASESARQHKLKPELISRWKGIALEGLEGLFQGDDQRGRDQDRIADLGRMVGRLTMELEVAKKASTLLPSVLRRDGRSS
jgi:transposase-like protein